MPKIEIELDTEILQRAEAIASRYGIPLEEWIENCVRRKAFQRAETSAWEPFQSIYGFVRLVLLIDWDPVGILGEPYAMDEYDTYVDGVYKLVSSGASEEALMAHLSQIEKGRMGVRRDRPEVRQTAAQLRLLYATQQWKKDAIRALSNDETTERNHTNGTE